MESNGKSINRNNCEVEHNTGPIGNNLNSFRKFLIINGVRFLEFLYQPNSNLQAK